MSWVLDAPLQKEGDVSRGSIQRMGEIIQGIMNSKHQLPRTVIFGESKSHDKPGFLETKTRQNVRQEMVVKHWTNANAENLELLPEYRELVNPDAGSDKVIWKCDIDVYAFEEHARRIGFVPWSVKEDTGDRINEIIKVNGQNVCHFFGTPVSDITPDRLRFVTEDQIKKIRDCIETFDDEDDQFDPKRFLLEDGVGHWNIVAELYDPNDFGFSEWATDETVLITQYKMRCAFHPIIIMDRYMLAEERLAYHEKRAILDVPFPEASEEELAAAMGAFDQLHPIGSTGEEEDVSMSDSGFSKPIQPFRPLGNAGSVGLFDPETVDNL
jgi:hypothetical protein